MKTSNKLIATLTFALISTQIHAVQFSFLQSPVTPKTFGNSYSATVNAITLSATAWSTTGSGGKFQTAELEIYPGYGMGVCNRDEGVNCSSGGNNHALDNHGADDLILFSFSSAVKLDTLKLLQFGGDSDLNLWAGSGIINLNGVAPSALGSATLITNNKNANTIRTINLHTPLNGSYTWFAVAPSIGEDNDYVKLQSLTISRFTQPVPEPETWAMMLTGLGLIGFAVRRRV